MQHIFLAFMWAWRPSHFLVEVVRQVHSWPMGCSCTIITIITTINLEGHDNKDLSPKAKARTNDYNFVLKDN